MDDHEGLEHGGLNALYITVVKKVIFKNYNFGIQGEKKMKRFSSSQALLAVGCLLLIFFSPMSAQAVLSPGTGQAGAGQLPGAGSIVLDDGFLLETQTLNSKLSPAQKKLGTDLLQLTSGEMFQDWNSRENQILAMEELSQFVPMSALPDPEAQIQEGTVYVYVSLKMGYATSVVDPYAQEVTDRDENNGIAVAWIQVKNLETLAAQEGVRQIRTVMPPITKAGSVTTEGDGIHRTADVRTTYGQSGSGMKVGIISDGVNTRATAQASGDLPADGAGLTVLSDIMGGDEGTAMLEIVHDMIPSADLYFHDHGANVVAFNTAIDNLVTAGCKVVCDDIGWLTQPFYEDGTVASHVSSVLAANDIIYVSSAGNAGSGHYQGDYCQLGTGTQHDFSCGGGTGNYLYLNMPAGSSVIVVLQWNDQFGASGNDYNLYLFDMTSLTQQTQSVVVQDGDDDPLEAFQFTATTADNYAIVVDKYSGAARNLEVYIYPSGCSVYTNNITPVDAIFGHPAVPGALGVGAIAANDPGNDDIETFSSQGPVTISYPSSESRSKPDICGIDGVAVTGAGGFSNPFYGTSAAAPHVAAVCAQLWAQYPGMTGDQVRDIVKSTAVDLGTAGFDTVFGNGRADAVNAFQSLDSGEQPANLIDWNGNLVADFGSHGMWYHDGSAWHWMTNTGNVGQMTVWNNNLVVDFGAGSGLQYYDGSWHWMTNKGDAALMEDWNSGSTDKLVVDFGGGRGVYTYDGSWTWFSNKDDVADMDVWNNKLIVDFGSGRGLYSYDTAWNWMSNKDDVAMMLPWDNGGSEVLVVDFGGGRRMYTYNGAWSWFTNKDDVNDMAVWNNKLIVDFGSGRGLYSYDTAWNWMTNKDDVAGMTAWYDGSADNLAVDFGSGRNMYNYTGAWSWIKNANDVPEMIAWNNRLAVDFGSGTGVYNYNGAWNLMKNWSTAD